MTHELKLWPEYFDDVADGTKPFEIRKLDKPFSIGDILHLREFSADTKGYGYTGRETFKEITYIFIGGEFDIPVGIGILGLKTLTPSKEE